MIQDNSLFNEKDVIVSNYKNKCIEYLLEASIIKKQIYV